MALRIVAGSANPELAAAVAAHLDTEVVETELERFPDGELRPSLRPVRGDDVYLLQPTAPPVNEHLVELLLLADACRRAGAGRLTAVVPYFGYARQDRRVTAGQGVGARAVLDALAGAGAQRLVVVDPHGPSFEAMSAVPVETLSAVPTLAQALGQMGPAPLAVVAPDLGAVRLAERLATTLGAPVAVVQKTRRTATSVRANQVVGEVAGCLPVIVDDMIATGGTIEASVGLLEQHGALPGAVVATSHGLFVGPASERLGRLGLGRLVATDTVASSQTPLDQGPHIERCSVAPLLAAAVARLHGEQPLGDLGVVG